MKRFLALALAVMMILSFAACGGEKGKDGEIPTLVWYVHGDKQHDVAAVMEKVNEITVPAIGAKLDLQFLDQPSYPQKMNMMMASGTEFDICFTGYVNDYKQAVEKGGFLELDEYLKDMPDLYNSMPEYTWDTVRFQDGHIYAIPNYQIMSIQLNMFTFKDLADKYGLTDQVEPGGKISQKQLEDYLTKIKENEPSYYPLRPNYLTTYFETYDDENIHRYDETINDVEVRFTKDGELLDIVTGDPDGEKLYTYKKAHEWYKKGLVREDVVSMSNDTAEWNAGKYATWIEKWKPGLLQERNIKYGREVITYQITENKYPSAAPEAMTAVSRTSKHPELALKMLELVNTNEELYNLICYGIEGKHYNLDEDGRVVYVDGSGYGPKASWKFGNQFNALLLPGQPDDVWEQTKKMNEEAIRSPLIGFNFDIKNITNEISAMATVKSRYSALSKGATEPTAMAEEYLAKQKEAGIERIEAEFEKQYNEWVKKQK